MDEQPVPLLQETRVPIAATKPHGQRVEDAYERHGTASMFMGAEPLSAVRQATARRRRTNADGAIDVAHRLDTRDADRAAVTRVCAHLTTHTTGAFYDAFEPGQARAYSKRSTCGDTPTHGRWLQVAECALSCLTSPCLSDRRSGAMIDRQTAIAVWSDTTNAKPRGVAWQCRSAEARVNLKRLYPKMKA